MSTYSLYQIGKCWPIFKYIFYLSSHVDCIAYVLRCLKTSYTSLKCVHFERTVLSDSFCFLSVFFLTSDSLIFPSTMFNLPWILTCVYAILHNIVFISRILSYSLFVFFPSLLFQYIKCTHNNWIDIMCWFWSPCQFWIDWNRLTLSPIRLYFFYFDCLVLF